MKQAKGDFPLCIIYIFNSWRLRNRNAWPLDWWTSQQEDYLIFNAAYQDELSQYNAGS